MTTSVARRKSAAPLSPAHSGRGPGASGPSGCGHAVGRTHRGIALDRASPASWARTRTASRGRLARGRAQWLRGRRAPHGRAEEEGRGPGAGRGAKPNTKWPVGPPLPRSNARATQRMGQRFSVQKIFGGKPAGRKGTHEPMPMGVNRTSPLATAHGARGRSTAATRRGVAVAPPGLNRPAGQVRGPATGRRLGHGRGVRTSRRSEPGANALPGASDTSLTGQCGRAEL